MKPGTEQGKLAAGRAALEEQRGPEYWRSLGELADTPEFREYLGREFPAQAGQWQDPVGRRRFLKLMGASLALAGVGSCTRQPEEEIVPYVKAPEELVPGKPLFFASAFTLGGYATGVLVENHMGRPTKIEGNPGHPASLGATDTFAQASILELYDPDRSQVVRHRGRISTWDSFLASLRTELELQDLKRGAGLRFLTETVTSPTLAWQLGRLAERFPAARWHQYQPLNRDEARRASRLAFGEVVDTRYRFELADVVCSLDSDFLTAGPGCLAYAREFMKRRLPGGDPSRMNRLYVAESCPSSTGAVADHRLPLAPSGIHRLAGRLARRLGAWPGDEPEAAGQPPHREWVEALARDLEAHRGRCLVLAGEHQPPAVQLLCHLMNQHLGNLGRTVVHTEPVEPNPAVQIESLQDLVADLTANRVDVLIILGGNPVYTAPADLDFARRMRSARARIHLGLYDDETSELCHWHVPETHYLESWSDARCWDGTASIIQPLIAPLYNGRSPHELLAALLGEPGQSSHDAVRGYWRQQRSGADFEAFWQTALHDGRIAGSQAAPREVEVEPETAARTLAEASEPGGELEICIRPDPAIHDGRFSNNGWLQELPKPLTKLTWDNALLMSAATARRHGLSNQDEVEIQIEGRTAAAPVWILPGHAPACATVHLGYGRDRAGRVGTGLGFNAYRLRTSRALWTAAGASLRATGERRTLAVTQHHHLLDGRALIRSASLSEYREDPRFAEHMVHAPGDEMTLYPPHQYEGYAWGMAINLNACIGCNACVVACQSENNIPVVGKEEVLMGREMHWIRVDQYYRGELENPESHFQPLPCMHCENAPCEPVCPVGATVHGREGLNEMIYNRCVGTRYCSNNCPYKVRRFNFLLYSDFETSSLELLRNPDVTVRTRGVMEKCTYCVQRINAARIQAKKEDRQIRDGEAVTACQQVCPTEAIVFGDTNDPDSRVARMKESPLNYGLLEELNTRPRTTYWARVRNPNPELEGA